MKAPLHRFKTFDPNDENHKDFFGWSCLSWLGSGVKDKNGREIYEGDIVRHKIWEKDMPVTFHNGAFWLGDTDCPLCYQFGKLLEINGHIAEEGNNHVDC